MTGWGRGVSAFLFGFALGKGGWRVKGRKAGRTFPKAGYRQVQNPQVVKTLKHYLKAYDEKRGRVGDKKQIKLTRSKSFNPFAALDR